MIAKKEFTSPRDDYLVIKSVHPGTRYRGTVPLDYQYQVRSTRVQNYY